jgi:hypothetical protein
MLSSAKEQLREMQMLLVFLNDPRRSAKQEIQIVALKQEGAFYWEVMWSWLVTFAVLNRGSVESASVSFVARQLNQTLEKAPMSDACANRREIIFVDMPHIWSVHCIPKWLE